MRRESNPLESGYDDRIHDAAGPNSGDGGPSFPCGLGSLRQAAAGACRKGKQEQSNPHPRCVPCVDDHSRGSVACPRRSCGQGPVSA
jgi:hypothetical protein